MSEPKRKAALVTGAGVRLGRAIAVKLAADGYDLALHYRSSKAQVAETESLCRQQGAQCLRVAADLAEVEQIDRLIGEVLAWSPRLKLLVNNASIFFKTPDLPSVRQHWSAFIDVNLRAPFLLVCGFEQALRQSRGSVVNLIDIHAERPLKHYAPYNVSKSGLLGMTRSLAIDLAPEIRVNAVSPGAALPPSDNPDKPSGAVTEGVPLGRMSGSDPIAEAVVYLANADYVTGHNLVVDGGRLHSW